MDTANGGLFSNYNGPSKPTTGPNPSQSYAPYGTPMQDADSQFMTEAEREEAQVQNAKAEIKAELSGMRSTTGRVLGNLRDVDRQTDEMLDNFQQQENHLDNVDRSLSSTGKF